MGNERFNAFFAPSELPGQLNVARRGNIMCACVVATPWAGGVWNYDGFIKWIAGEVQNEQKSR